MIWTPVVAIICIAGLEALALVKGVDGAMMGIVIAAIAGLGGYGVKAIKDKIKGGKQ
ncbi:hypothetical protein ES703_47744 [subsurface metagenome]